MTKEQAIEHLYDITTDVLYRVTTEEKEALDMAIRALEQPTSNDCVSRAEVLKFVEYFNNPTFIEPMGTLRNMLKDLPPVTPTHGTCKDCKHWKDSDGVYRRGIGAESKCPVNNSRVFEGNFCCADYEKRGNENEIN